MGVKNDDTTIYIAISNLLVKRRPTKRCIRVYNEGPCAIPPENVPSLEKPKISGANWRVRLQDGHMCKNALPGERNWNYGIGGLLRCSATDGAGASRIKSVMVVRGGDTRAIPSKHKIGAKWAHFFERNRRIKFYDGELILAHAMPGGGRFGNPLRFLARLFIHLFAHVVKTLDPGHLR